MNKVILLYLSFLLLAGCTERITNEAILKRAIEIRISTLEKNYKYQVLSAYGYLEDYNSFLMPLTELLASSDFNGLKGELTKWSNSMGVDLPKPNQSTVELDVNTSILLLLDNLIMKTLEFTVPFSEIDPIVFLEQENDSIASFYVALHAKDSLFLPEVLLELSTGTFPILVDERTGLATFTIRKSHKNDKKQFKGTVLFMSGENGIKIGEFQYPRELNKERDYHAPQQK